MVKKKEESVQIVIPPLRKERFKVKVVGESPLIVNRFSEKAKGTIADGQSGKAQRKKAPRDPDMEFRAAMHHPNGVKTKHGFPAVGFAKAAVAACRNVAGVPMTLAKQAFFVEGIDDPSMVTIKSKPAIMRDGWPIMREDWVRIGQGKTSLAYRPEYRDWSAEFIICYNVDVITPEQIVNLVNQAGFGVGVGEWRPERGGSFGRYHVEVSK